MDDYLDAVREQLRELTERRGRRAPVRRRRLLDALAVAVVAGVAGAVLAVAFVFGPAPPRAHKRTAAATAVRHTLTHHHDSSSQPRWPAPRGQVVAAGSGVSQAGAGVPGAGAAPPGVSPPGGPVPPGFSPRSFTAIGELTWWLLGSAPCSTPPCTSIVRTEDGGRTFVGIPAPRTDGVSQLRFADPQDGFAYGPQLWVTHDGGASWRQLSLGGPVADLATSGGYVYAIVRGADGRGLLMRSPVSTDSWSSLGAAGDVFPGEGLWAQSATVLALAEHPAGIVSGMLVSDDDGRTFSERPLPPSIACKLQEPQPPVIWERCSTGMLSGLWRSPDGGQTFASAGGPASGLPPLPNSAAFAAASASVAVVGYQRLYRTGDGGGSWSAVAGLPALQWTYLGFTDPTHGVAIGSQGQSGPAQLYYTTDGGLSYHPVAIR